MDGFVGDERLSSASSHRHRGCGGDGGLHFLQHGAGSARQYSAGADSELFRGGDALDLSAFFEKISRSVELGD